MRRILRQASLWLSVVIVLAATGAVAQEPIAPSRSMARTRAVRVTPEQRANAAQRFALATAIVDSHQAEADSLGLAPGWRQSLVETLLPLSPNRLRDLAKAATISELTAAVNAAPPVESNDFGSVTQDLVYKPIAPCRYIDTRIAGGKITGTRGYHIAVAGSSYGGNAACNPTALFGVNENYFGALVVNVTAFGPTAAPGYAAIKPNSAAPLASLLNWYEAGSTVQIANQAIITTDQSMAADEFLIQTSSSVDILVDIFGAFVAPEATPVSHYIVTGSVAVPTGQIGDVYSPPCPAGYRLTGGGYVSGTSSYTGPHPIASRPVMGADNALVSGADSADRWLVQVSNTTGSTQTVISFAICSRVPGR